MPRIGVRADQPGDLHIEAGLLTDLPDGRSRQRLAEIHRPARQRVQAAVGPPLKQDAPSPSVTTADAATTNLFGPGTSGSS